jgi:hypothetical protein
MTSPNANIIADIGPEDYNPIFMPSIIKLCSSSDRISQEPCFVDKALKEMWIQGQRYTIVEAYSGL